MHRIHRAIALLSIIILSFLPFPATITAQDGSRKPSFQIDFIDVGQGDSALIQCDGHYMLIDGGDASKSSLIYSYLKTRFIKNIDVMVATHADEDHIGGLSGALNYSNVGTALCPVTQNDTKAFSNFVKYLNAQGRAITVPRAGTSFSLGSATVYILGPISKGSESNNDSIVLRIVYGYASFLFTGDAEIEEENEILNSGQTVQSSILKVGHHGSKSSTSDAFLRKVAPRYAVISVGSDNSYGHPTSEVLSRLRNAGIKVLRTDLQGDIICTSDGRSIDLYVQKNPNINTYDYAGAAQTADRSIISITPTENNSVVTPDRSYSENGTTMPQSYVLNTNKKKFHRPDCGSVSEMKEKNKRYYTGSREEIIAQGYDPCKRCNP